MIEILLFIAVVVGVLAWRFLKSSSHDNKITRHRPRSVLVNVFGKSVKLMPVVIEPIAGHASYVLVASDLRVGEDSADARAIDSIIMKIALPFVSDVQIVGFSHRHEPMSSQIESLANKRGLEKVRLEGDFRDYFELYATKDSQTLARVLMDPQAMAFVIDFCQSHTWEVVGNELCFAMSAESTQSTSDPTLMAADINEFIRIISPATSAQKQSSL